MTVARPIPHESARLHVTGTARYADDVPAPEGCLHLAFGLAEHAAGTLRSLDLDAVRAAPGVVDVLTADDFDVMPDCSPSNGDEPLLCTGTIHYAGQPLYLVIATSHLAARRAARLHEAEVEETTPILTIEDALAARSWFDGGPRTWTDGDVEAGLAAAPHRLEGVIEIGGQEHFYLEGHAALALPGEAGEMHVLTSTQHPTEIQHKVADALGVPMHAVRSEVRRMGGGFGGKESQGNALAIACAVAARRTGRAARMRYDRDDDFVVTGKRHDFRIAYEVGHDDGGPRARRPVPALDALRLGAGPVAAGGRPRDAACRQRLRHPRHVDRELAPAHQHPVGHRLPRLRRAAGDARDRAGDGPRRPCHRARPARGARRQLLRRRRLPTLARRAGRAARITGSPSRTPPSTP